MRVCHVISGYQRNDARVFQRQCKSLHANGYEVSLLTNDGEQESSENGISFFVCEKFWENRLKVIFFAKRQFYKRALEVNADIYQFHSPELLSLGLALKKAGKKVVYDAHEDLPRHILEKEWLPNFMRRPISVLVDFYMNMTLKKFDAIVTPHTHVKSSLELINQNTHLVANFPLISRNETFSINDYMSRDKIMCYTGTVYSYSNQEAILDAMASVPDVQYEIAGHIDTLHLDSLKNHKSFSRVKFLGRIPWKDMSLFYSKVIIGLVIYDYKLNLGYKLGSYGTNKIFEYMEAGIPFICTDYQLWNDIVLEYDCGICVKPGNINQIAEAIRFLVNNPEKAYIMGQNGRKAVLDKFNWSSQESVYLNVFNNL